VTQGLALHWRLIPQRYNLEATKCATCGTHFFPKRHFCPNCRRKGKVEETSLSGRGEVFAHTTIHAPPAGFDNQKPYALGIIKLEEGAMVTAQIVDANPDEVEVGMKVELAFRRIMADSEGGIIKYGYKFRPAK